MVKLPDKLSDLIDLAVKDARSLDPETYQPYASFWHYPHDNGRCSVCLAGAVIAGTLNVDPELDRTPSDFDDDTECKLHALEHVRFGSIVEAIQTRDVYYSIAEQAAKDIHNEVGSCEHTQFVSWEEFEQFLQWCSDTSSALRERGY